jgi:hypothetical protein
MTIVSSATAAADPEAASKATPFSFVSSTVFSLENALATLLANDANMEVRKRIEYYIQGDRFIIHALHHAQLSQARRHQQ